MKKLKLGYAPTRRFTFSAEDAFRYKVAIRQQIESFGMNIDIVDLEGLNEEGLLYDDHINADLIIKRFKEEEVDAVFFPHCNFGTEDTVARVGKALGKPVLLWGPRDEAPLADGMRLRDTQCGLFASGKVLRRFNVPFSYITNSRVADPVFERGFNNFISAANVVRQFKNLRILQIGPRPASFWTMICNEGELLERFGIEIHPITLVDIQLRSKKIAAGSSAELSEAIDYIKEKLDYSEVTEEDIRRIAALKVAMKSYAIETGSTAIAIQCWSSLQEAMGIMPCLANAILTDEQIPVTCETDIHGAITSVMVQAAAMNELPTFFADITVRHPENDNGELLFHCGNFPVSMSIENKPKLRKHFLFDDHAPGTHEGQIKGGGMTIARFDGDHGDYSIFLGKAKGIEGPYTRGSYVWVEVNDWPLWEEKLVKGPYVHHSVGIHANVIPALYEACNYLPGVTADPVDPTEQEIQRWLRGSDLAVTKSGILV
ncbi:L-fucose/L-arabinose isomerase family protein [Paenibacillus polymyxa]|uniref:L-fucose/L-arabinose isomerase family protein n=1 Tax=Paenibacillus polymyxa TaxID=1406 RepID=UPI0025B69465|nr:L-fucose/L-arabinose isomerase family protein [Paenibacillus polymyxa]MDN4079921.1 L-fucose/L-arabinose isomerase family protein [Paenibacillus polymyxa]MDN4105456.1 L-fucose/L-arabinose isomerase family protein [Paenibacillus polymyxa]MDN4115810.1 L-fucose/L-arabinose isomerase family protein [Paenibacillus polymyxa]